MSTPTKLHVLLDGRQVWDVDTWHQVERYLVDNTSVPTMAALLDFLGAPDTVPRYFKTDMVKFIRAVTPALVPHAFDSVRHQQPDRHG